MRGSAILLGALGAVVLCVGLTAQPGQGRGGTSIKPGEECPPGMTEVRPQNCQAPEFPPPSIVDYRPESTLVVPEHQAVLEPPYEARLLEELRIVLAEVPHDQLAVQWDTNFEFGMLEGAFPVWFDDAKGGILERLLRLSRHLNED